MWGGSCPVLDFYMNVLKPRVPQPQVGDSELNLQLWTSLDNAEISLDFRYGEKAMTTRIIVRYFFPLFLSLLSRVFFSSRQRDETPSFPDHSLKTLFRGWRRSKSLTFLAVWWIVKEKLAEHGSPPTLIYIYIYWGREKDFKDHNRMSVVSSITDKKCKTSKRRRNFDSFWWR